MDQNTIYLIESILFYACIFFGGLIMIFLLLLCHAYRIPQKRVHFKPIRKQQVEKVPEQVNHIEHIYPEMVRQSQQL